MLKIGDKLTTYLDDIEGYRLFEVTNIIEPQRYLLQGLNTATSLVRHFDNQVPDKRFQYNVVTDEEAELLLKKMSLPQD